MACRWIFLQSFELLVLVCGAVFFPNHLPVIDATCSRSDFCPIVSPIPMASSHCQGARRSCKEADASGQSELDNRVCKNYFLKIMCTRILKFSNWKSLVVSSRKRHWRTSFLLHQVRRKTNQVREEAVDLGLNSMLTFQMFPTSCLSLRQKVFAQSCWWMSYFEREMK